MVVSLIMPENIFDIITRISAFVIGIYLIYYSLSRFMRLLNSLEEKKEKKEEKKEDYDK